MKNKKFRIIAFALFIIITLTSFSACGKKKDTTSATETEYVLETIEPQVLFDESGVKVTVNGIVDSETYGKGISLTFENKTIKTLTFDCKKMIINGVMSPDLFGERVQAGDTVDMVGYFGTGMMNYLGITNVGEIQLQFECYGIENYESVYKSELISIKTSEYDNIDTTPDFDGEKIFEGEGITIYGKMANDDIFSQAMLYYIVNDTDKELLYKSTGVTIDGEFNEYIYGFTMCADCSKLYYLEFENTESEDVEKAPAGTVFSMNFEIYDRADLSLICETGDLELCVE